jgi:hypothetical protein
MVPPFESNSNVMLMLVVIACTIKKNPYIQSGTFTFSILKKGHLKSLQLIPHLILLLSLEPFKIKDDQ